MCIIYPEAVWKPFWDMFIALILLFTCVVTPARIALTGEEDNLTWTIVNGTIDICFLLDIIFILNTAYLDDNYKLVDSRKEIAVTYMKAWFIIDLLALIPFDLIMKVTDINSMIRLSRLGRLYKLARLSKILRITRLLR